MFWVEYLIQLIYISIVTLLLLIILPILEKIFRARSLRILLCFMAALYLFPVGFLTNVLTIIPKEQEGSIVRNFSILSRTIIETLEIKENINITIVVQVIIGIGILIRLVNDLKKQKNLMSLIRRWNKKEISPNFYKIFAQVIDEFNMRGKVELLENEVILSPMAVGIHKKYIIMPFRLRNMSDEKIYNYLSHEVTHLKYNDNALSLILRLIEIINWYNPVVHYLMKTEKTYCELACDERVLCDKEEDFRFQYARTIVDTLTWQTRIQVPGGSSFFSGSDIARRRVKAATHHRKKKRGIILGTLFLITVVGGLTITSSKLSLTNSNTYLKCKSIIQNGNIDSPNYYNNIFGKIFAEINKSTFLKYNEYGLKYDMDTGRLHYQNKLVRNFEDIHFFTKSVIYFEDGEIDVHIVRNRWGNVETIKANEI